MLQMQPMLELPLHRQVQIILLVMLPILINHSLMILTARALMTSGHRLMLQQ